MAAEAAPNSFLGSSPFPMRRLRQATDDGAPSDRLDRALDRHPPSHRSYRSGGGKALVSARLLPAGVTWERVAELFSAALDRPVAERATFLTTACGDNVALLTEVSSLLRSLGLAGDFLEPGTMVGPPLSPSLLGELNETPLFTQFKPGAVIGQRYRVQALLGRGGTGEVYEAWDEELAIPVALKTLHFGAALGGDALRSLKQEAMLARAVVHPNVCRVYDLACHGDPQNRTWFLTMEVLRGETLAERLHARGRFTSEEALPLVEQMAAGLEAAHQSGIVHLDFKSGNVMITGDTGKELVVVTDFGLARTVQTMSEDRAEEESDSEAIVGTPAYMAPEQVHGRPAGPATDIYALGIVLYEMVTGTLPFSGATPLEVARKRLETAPPSARSVVPELDDRWEAVIRRCLEREPGRRFSRGKDVTEALAGQQAAVETGVLSASLARHSLPIERDRFLGREHELMALRQAVAGRTRLITLLGAGGMGKTRLAVRYGWLSREQWPGGVWFCDLTEAHDLSGVVSAVAKSLGVLLGREDPVERLGHAIAGRGRCLVIIDNLEQVITEGRAVLHQWLERAPAASFLVTSRERLGDKDEVTLDVEPLSPAMGLELFIERARRLCPGLELVDRELAAAQEVVRLVEGIPLAIELAAARMRLMSASQMMAAMHKRFALLTGGPSERHETLGAVIDGSWNLLQTWERAALAQCSVFEGGFTLAAAESVLDVSAYSDAPWTLDILQSLLDKSLLRTWVPDGATGTWLPEARFGMYVSLQEYAREKLANDVGGASGGGSQAQETEGRHGRWYARFGSQENIQALDSLGGAERRRALGIEVENLLVASRRAAARGDGDTAIAAYVAAWEVISIRGPYRLLIDLGEQILSGSLSKPQRARALTIAARSEMFAGRLKEARTHFESALALYRDAGDRVGESGTLATLGSISTALGRIGLGQAYNQAALAIHQELGDRRGEAIDLGHLGIFNMRHGRVERARALYEASLAIHRETGHRRFEGVVLGYLGNMNLNQGRVNEARVHYEAQLEINREVGDRLYEGMILANIGILESEQGRFQQALAYFEAALAIHREVGDRRSEGTALGDLGDMYCEQGRVSEAQVYLEAALAIHRETGDRLYEGIVLGNLGRLHLDAGRIAEAQVFYEMSIARSREAVNPRIEGIFLGQLGNLHLSEGRFEEARKHYTAGIATLHKVGIPRYEAVVRGYLAHLLFQEGKMAEAREALAQAEGTLRAVKDQLELANLLCVRAKVEHATGSSTEARTTLGEIQGLAALIGMGPESVLGRKLAELRKSLT